MKRILTPLWLAFLALPAAAEDTAFCQEIWLSRNTVMDRAGQCFTSHLGQAVFDNADCTQGDVRLSPLDAEIVRMATQMEARFDCRVNTDAEGLLPGALPFHARLTELFTIPVRADSEHGCRGYSGAPITLHAGMSPHTSILGTVEQGQGYSLSHFPMRGGWEYLEVYDAESRPIAHGWTQDTPTNMDACAFSAG